MSSSPVTRKPVLIPEDPQPMPPGKPPKGKVIVLVPLEKDPPPSSR